MTKDEALREAIDTLKSAKHGNCDYAWIDETIEKCTAALAQPEPTCPECNAAVLYECVACSNNNYPPAAKWDKPSANFNEWWDSNVMPPANPFAEGSAAYWAWAGWKAAQRPWQELTDEDWDHIGNKKGTALDTFAQGAAWAAARLKEKNT